MAQGLRITRRQWMAAAGSTLLVPTILRAQSAGEPVVRTPFGRVRGQPDNGTMRFLGVPYGKAPGRFMRARDVTWDGTRDAFEFGPISPQGQGPGGGDQPMSEDCQVLNIWTPATDSARRPVMVWLHGGGFTSGSANGPTFDGAALAAEHDVVVVTINHRLGPVGMLKLDHLDPQFLDSGTAGILDIVDALRWVARAIPAFGGDPDCVTIFGQSGGGGKVLTLLTMPEACHYFHRAIVQSGTMLQTAATPEQGIEMTGRILRELGIAESEAARIAEVPLDRLMAAGNAAMAQRNPGMRPFSPVIDMRNLPEQPFHGHAPEPSRHIPIMVGSTIEELRAFNTGNARLFALDFEGARRELQGILGDRTDSAIAAYRSARPDAVPSDIYFGLTADEMYWSGSIGVNELKAKQHGAPVYTYRFAFDPDRATRGTTPSAGAGHGQEIKYIFEHIPDDASASERRMERELSGAWAEFARHGHPNGAGLPVWLPYDTEQRWTMVFDEMSQQVSDPYRIEREWWLANL